MARKKRVVTAQQKKNIVRNRGEQRRFIQAVEDTVLFGQVSKTKPGSKERVVGEKKLGRRVARSSVRGLSKLPKEKRKEISAFLRGDDLVVKKESESSDEVLKRAMKKRGLLK